MTTASRRKLKILMAHNYYQQPGGEDGVFAAEVALLRENGHKVIEYVDCNKRIKKMHPLAVFRDTLWSFHTYKKFVKLIKEEKPDIAHFHNIFPLISPSAYYACKKMGVPVVQTIHNYRLLCPGAFFFRDGRICEKCIGNFFPIYQTLDDYIDNFFNKKMSRADNSILNFPWSAVFHKCYKKSYLYSFVVSLMIFIHRVLGTWINKVDGYIVLTEFGRFKFIEGGLPEDKIFVKSNFIYPDPGMREDFHGDYILFVGRLSAEKGLRTFLRTWDNKENISLKIVGDGPLRKELEDFVRIKEINNIEFLGKKSKEEVYSLMKKACFLLFPSKWYEGFPLTILEAFACGLPVVAFRIGAMSEYLGLYLMNKNENNLMDIVKNVLENKNIGKLQLDFRKCFEDNYTSERNINLLENYL